MKNRTTEQLKRSLTGRAMSLKNLKAACAGALVVGALLATLPAFSEDGDAPPVKKGYSAEAVKHYNTGLKLHQSGYLQKAIEEYKLAIASDDTLEQAYSNLGLIYISQKSYALAQEAFDKALKLKPNRPTSLNGLASVLYARGQTAPAIENGRKRSKWILNSPAPISTWAPLSKRKRKPRRR